MPDQPTPASAPETAPAPVETPAAQPSDRAAIYAKYYANQPPVEAPAAPAPAAPSVETPAIPTETPAAPPTIEDRFSALEQKFSALMEKLTPPAPATPAAPETATPPGWLDLLREGKLDEGERVLAQRMASLARGDVVAEALEVFDIRTKATQFLTDFWAKNSELKPLESLMGAIARDRLAAAQSAIKSPTDYLEQYRSAVDFAGNEARKVLQQIRASAKAEANVISREVLSASGLPPSAIEQTRGTPATPPEPPDTSFETYMKKRTEAQRAKQGLL